MYPGRCPVTGEWLEVASPGVLRQLAGGELAQPSVDAHHWEMFGFIMLLDMFPEVVRNRHVIVKSDSVTAIKCARDLTAALDSPPLAHLTRQFLGLCVRLNVRLLTQHVPGFENTLADPLSRDDLGLFALRAREWVCEHKCVQSAYLALLARG